MTTYLGKSCLFGLPWVPFVNCSQFMYLVISLLVLRAGCGIWLYQFLIIAYLFTFHFYHQENLRVNRTSEVHNNVKFSSTENTFMTNAFGLISVLRPFNTFEVISRAVSYPYHTVPGQASSAVYQYLVHILSSVTDNCCSWISGRGRMATEIFSWPSLHEEFACRGVRTRGRLHAKRTCFWSSYRARQTNALLKWRFYLSIAYKQMETDSN